MTGLEEKRRVDGGGLLRDVSANNNDMHYADWRSLALTPIDEFGFDPFQLAQDSPESLTNDLRSGHATTLRFSRKGDYLASGRVDGKIVIWDMETMGVAMKLHGHWKQIQSLSWSRDGRYLLSASQDCRACLWDLQTQTRIRTAKFEAPIYTAELHPYNRNLFVVSLFEDRPCLVDVTQPTAIKHFLPTNPISGDGDGGGGGGRSESKQATTSAIFSVLGNHLITGTSKGYINILETQTRTIIHSTKLSSGLISLIRLTANGRQLLVNSTDRIIRVVNVPDLSLLKPSTSDGGNGSNGSGNDGNGTGHNHYPVLGHALEGDSDNDGDDDDDDRPETHLTADTLTLHTEHKFQDLVNRLRWNHCAFSHSSSSSLTGGGGAADYVTASTYMKKDIYIWELRTNSLLRILENREEPAVIEWHPSKPLLACTSIETGSIQIWGIEPQQKWSALAPDFTEVTENVEYVEREDEFDTYPEEEVLKRRMDAEDEDVDVLTIGRQVHHQNPNQHHHQYYNNNNNNTTTNGTHGENEEDQTFVLPMLYDIEDSEVDDQELVRLGVGTMRKKEVNEGKDYEDDGEASSTPRIMPAEVRDKDKKKRR